MNIIKNIFGYWNTMLGRAKLRRLIYLENKTIFF